MPPLAEVCCDNDVGFKVVGEDASGGLWGSPNAKKVLVRDYAGIDGVFPDVILSGFWVLKPPRFNNLNITIVLNVASGFLRECAEAMAHKLVSNPAGGDEATSEADVLEGGMVSALDAVEEQPFG